MNDPHVVALHYAAKPGDGVTYDNPPSLSVVQTEFELELRSDGAVATMRAHYATSDDACSVVDPFLKAWELDSALTSGGRLLLRFTFEDAKVIDRNPPPPGTVQVAPASARAMGHAPVLAIGQAARQQYPAPPTIRINADVETLWFRYSLYKEGRDSLTGMAYFCKSYVAWLEREQGADFAISGNIFSKLGRLASIGDEKTARKWDKVRERRAHTPKEVEWIDAAIRALIRRVGEHAARLPLRELTMADLPRIS